MVLRRLRVRASPNVLVSLSSALLSTLPLVSLTTISLHILLTQSRDDSRSGCVQRSVRGGGSIRPSAGCLLERKASLPYVLMRPCCTHLTAALPLCCFVRSHSFALVLTSRCLLSLCLVALRKRSVEINGSQDMHQRKRLPASRLQSINHGAQTQSLYGLSYR